jgi:hypothetical protein
MARSRVRLCPKAGQVRQAIELVSQFVLLVDLIRRSFGL